MQNDISWHKFDNLHEQSQTLAQRVAEDINRCLDLKQQATLCVPGGNTPVLFLNALSHTELDWSRVTVILNDERWVPLSDAKSNLAMLQSQLQQHKAKAVKLIEFCPCLNTPQENSNREREQFLAAFNADYFNEDNANNRESLSIDICVVGMGEDGHIASLFPNMPGLAAALNSSLSPALISADPPNKEARVSLNLSALLNAQHHYLLITGNAKQQIIQEEQATQIEQYPIGYLISKTSLAIYYSD